MPDTPFKCMGREPRPRSLRDGDTIREAFARFYDGDDPPSPSVECDRCGIWLYEGDWPWCKGNPDDHKR